VKAAHAWTSAVLSCLLASSAHGQQAVSSRDSSGAPPSAAGRDGAYGTREVAAAMARYAREPRVAEVVRAALRAAPKARSASLAGRARAAGWVPRLALRARRGQTIDLATPLEADVLRVKSNDDLTLEASLSFELDRLVFRPEEVALLRQERSEKQVRAALVRQVIHLYFERRRLQVERDLDPEPGVARAVRIQEIEALLDVFTNGAFQRMIAGTRWTTGAKPHEPLSTSPRKSN
jgi:hypothetical protein